MQDNVMVFVVVDDDEEGKASHESTEGDRDPFIPFVEVYIADGVETGSQNYFSPNVVFAKENQEKTKSCQYDKGKGKCELELERGGGEGLLLREVEERYDKLEEKSKAKDSNTECCNGYVGMPEVSDNKNADNDAPGCVN